MEIIRDYCEKHEFLWEKLSGFCTDGASATLGPRSGLATLIKEKKIAEKVTTRCTIYRYPLALKTLPKKL
jgi:hypothetical protein